MNIYEIERYSASHPDWVGSFSERLYEYGEWNAKEFWKLHKTLVDLAIEFRDKTHISKEIVRKVLGIQQSIDAIIIAHYSPICIVGIENIKDEVLWQYKERLDLAVMGVVTGDVLPENKFDLVNPLLIDN